MADHLLEVSDLRVSFATPSGPLRAVDGVSFALQRGEALAIVGESGSGKSVCAMSLVGLTRGPRVTVAGSALLEGRELIGASEARLRRVRGAEVAMIFQDPLSSLNPVMRVGQQIAEQITAHEPSVSRAKALERAGELMERVRIPAARARLRAYPHELSGGMRQRAMIAMALSLEPKLLLADEPTTALDATVQAQILELLGELREQGDMAIVLITHDFAVVAGMADRVAVMQAGRIVEQDTAARVLHEPRHPHTRELLRALASPAAPRAARAPGKTLLELEDLRVSFLSRGLTARVRARARSRTARVHALDGVSLTVRDGETLAVVGESGCGKTTLLRCIARLIEPAGGTIRFQGTDITRMRPRRLRAPRRSLGMVFQDPQASLNPRRRVGRTLERALSARGVPRAEIPAQADGLLARVGLRHEHALRFPHELSGGERQRVAIARALAGEPRLVLLDEPVSSLDASIRAQVIELLAQLQAQLGCAYVLVSHDLAMVAGVADRVAVMHSGRIVELAGARELFERPAHPHTRALLAAHHGIRSSGWAFR